MEKQIHPQNDLEDISFLLYLLLTNSDHIHNVEITQH